MPDSPTAAVTVVRPRASRSGATFLVAAALLVLVGASVAVLPLRSGTGTLDRTVVALGTPEPSLVFSPRPTDGPVTISLTHRVTAGQEAAFVTAMDSVGLSRRRTGATHWRLERSGDTVNSYREEFVAPSWGEFVSSERERWTGYDLERLNAALALTDGHPAEEHFFPIG